MIFTEIITKEDNTYIAKCSEVGTISQGQSIEEALSNLKEATMLYLKEFPITKKAEPVFTIFEVPEGAKT